MVTTTTFKKGMWDFPGQNRGAVWTINEACRVRGYDMSGVEVIAPDGYRVDFHPDGFDVTPPPLLVRALGALNPFVVIAVAGFVLGIIMAL